MREEGYEALAPRVNSGDFRAAGVHLPDVFGLLRVLVESSELLLGNPDLLDLAADIHPDEHSYPPNSDWPQCQLHTR